MQQKNDEQSKTYLYPKYIPKRLLIGGLFVQEWIACAIVLVVPLWMVGPIGLVPGIALAGTLFLLFHRREGRTNTLNQLQDFLSFTFSQRLILKKERTSTEVLEQAEDTTESGGTMKDKKMKAKQEKKQDKAKAKPTKTQKKKERYMQDYFAFRSINDGKITMEDGRVFLYLRIQGNNLDFLSYKEVHAMNALLAKSMDRSKYKISFFIQDSVFDIKYNVNNLKKKVTENPVQFVQRLASEIKDELLSVRKDAVNKASYIRIEVEKSERKNIKYEDILKSVKKTFKDTLSPSDVDKKELKQMLAIYGSRIFSEELPDTEVEYEDDFEEFLFVKKPKKYIDYQLPGIYEFKDFICPATTLFRPSDATIGSRHVRSYSIHNFLVDTEETSLLSKITTLKDVTTTMYLEPLSTAKYRNYMKLDLKGKRANQGDEIDEIDSNFDIDNKKLSYRQLKKSKENMYYLSVYFQLSADTHEKLMELEEDFKEQCSLVGITLDQLQTKQKQAWQSISPIGRDLLSELVKQNIPSGSVANLYPFNDASVLDKYGLPLGTIVDRNELVLYDPFQYRGSNFGILVLGASGYGKTVLMMLLLQNAYLLGTKIRNIDFEATYVDFINLLGGININMAGNNEYAINPLQVRIPDEIRDGLVDDFVSEVRSWMGSYKPGWSDSQLDLFEYYLGLTYKDKRITNDVNLKLLDNKDYPLLSDVVEQIKLGIKNYNNETSLGTVEDHKTLILGLHSCTSGADQKLFNRHTYLGEGNSKDIRLINFDISEISGGDDNRKIAQWLNVFTFVSQEVHANMDRQRKFMVAVDELHEFLKEQYMPVVDIMSSYDRRFRKYDACFLKATQTIEELNTEHKKLRDKVRTLLSQPATKFIFYLGDVNYADSQKLLSLNDTETAELQKPRNGECLMRINKTSYDLSVGAPEYFKTVKKDWYDNGKAQTTDS